MSSSVRTDASADTGSGASRTLADTTISQAWQRYRGPLLIGVVIVVLGVAYAIVSNGNSGSPMDPRSTERDGAKALAVLLTERGVDVERVDRLDQALAATGPRDTLLVTRPDLLAAGRLDRLKRAPTRHLVLFEPGESVLTGLTNGDVLPAGTAFGQLRAPGCGLPAAVRAGRADTGGRNYRLIGDDGFTCYGDSTRGSVVRARLAGSRTVDVIGAPSMFDNSNLDREGHAALGLGLLGERSELVWYVPSPFDIPSTGGTGLWSLLPDGVRYGFGGCAVALALLFVAAARRLGPVVPEPLPVVVRASEATEGRARLYQRLRARDRAAAELRLATAGRLRSLLGLPTVRSTAEPAAGPADRQADRQADGRADIELVAAVANRTGRDAADVDRLLGERAQRTPHDDGELVRFAAELDALEQEVRRS